MNNFFYFFSKVLVVCSVIFHGSTSFANNHEIVELLQEGEKVIFIRHAYAPGGGDPDNFNIEDCDTQRNLNQQGREQSQRIGNFFKQNAINTQHVYTSQWCRCRETASIAFGKFEELSALNSTFSSEHRHLHDQQMKDLRTFLDTWDGKENLIFITHYVIIGGATNYYPSSGEIVITDRNLQVLNSLEFEY